jgi:hypothetical protein
MILTAGYCNNQGYGFIHKIYNEKKFLENVFVRNYNNQPNIHDFFYDIKKKNSEKFIILIGAKSSQLNTYAKNGYLAIDQYNDCYLMEKND